MTFKELVFDHLRCPSTVYRHQNRRHDASCEPLQFPSLSTEVKIYRPAMRMPIPIESNIRKRIAFYITRAQYMRKVNTRREREKERKGDEDGTSGARAGEVLPLDPF